MTTQTVAMPVVAPNVPGLKLSSSRLVLGPDTKMAQLIWAPSGYGKTHLAGQLDALTQKYEGKRTLFLPLEPADGGGIATIRKLDVPMYTPTDYSDLNKTLASLKNDKTIGGVVVDSGSEMVKILVKPAAMKYPTRENVATRAEGVATRSDYQVMGEMTSQIFRALLLLTKHTDPAYRKHVIVTAADYTREEDERTVWVGPDLPGRMGREAVQMFQQVGTIILKPQNINGKREVIRYLTYTGDGVRALKDRFEIYPTDGMQIQKELSGPGESLTSIYEKYWLPNVVS